MEWSILSQRTDRCAVCSRVSRSRHSGNFTICRLRIPSARDSLPMDRLSAHYSRFWRWQSQGDLQDESSFQQCLLYAFCHKYSKPSSWVFGSSIPWQRNEDLAMIPTERVSWKMGFRDRNWYSERDQPLNSSDGLSSRVLSRRFLDFTATTTHLGWQCRSEFRGDPPEHGVRTEQSIAEKLAPFTHVE